MYTGTVTIGPTQAQVILDGTPKRRRPGDTRMVGYLAWLITEGKWRPGTLILLGPAGELLDGRHILLAIVQADQPAELVIEVSDRRDELPAVTPPAPAGTSPLHHPTGRDHG